MTATEPELLLPAPPAWTLSTANHRLALGSRDWQEGIFYGV